MFTDILDYSSLMQQDAPQVHILKERHHQILYSITKKYHGKVLQYYGGATLIIFQSAIDAVKCGIDLQSGFMKDPQIPVKIGIHTGDVIFDGEEIIGDGVNVASRVESLAVNGSVFISDRVYDEIRNQKSIQTQFLGTFNLKNVDRPIDLHVVSNDPLTVPAPDQFDQTRVQKTGGEAQVAPAWFHGHWKKLTVAGFSLLIILIAGVTLLVRRVEIELGQELEKTIAVIPFINLSKDLEQEYFSDGITEDIITQLSKIGDLKVISRTSVMGFKNTTKTTQEIAKQLEVTHILEGSVRKNEDRVRISIQLIDANTDKHLWANTFDRNMEDIFALQREVSMEVARALKAELTLKEEEDINKKPTENTEAYELYLQGLYHLRSGSMEGLNKSYPLLRQAINLDPEFAEAYAEIAGYYIRQGSWRGILTPELAKKEAMPYVLKALELDPNSENGRTQLGTIKWLFEWDFAGAEKEYIRGKSSRTYRFYGFFLLLMGRFQDAEDHFAESRRLNPMDPHDRTHRGVVQYFLNHPQRAIKILKDGISFYPNVLSGYHKLGKIYLNLGNYDEAIETLELGMEVDKDRIPSFLGDLAIAYFKSGQPEKAKEIIEELKSIESKGLQGSPSFYLAQIYAGIGELELAFETLEKSYEAHEVEMIWLKIEPQFNSLRNDPRFTDLLKRVGF